MNATSLSKPTRNNVRKSPLTRSNESFTVTWNDADGTLAALVLKGDDTGMNWIEGTDSWGAIRLHRMDFENGIDTWGDTTRMAFAGMREEGAAVISTYRLGPIRADVRREVTAEGLEESYVFTNEATYPVYFLRGHLGILATFNDSYAPASVSETQRCHAHIWCGGENSWVRALKMGPYPTELALILQEGDLDAYSVRRLYGEQSNDRGDFVLHPAPFHLNPGATKTIAWKIVAYPAGKFDEALLRNGGVKIDFRQETIFPGETFEIDVTGPDGKTVHHSRKPDHGVGEYDFEFDVCGRKAKACGYCAPDFDGLVSARVRFIVEKQQCLEPDSPLYGAYLIWDSEDGAPYFDYLWRDHNACRERVVMALTVARWLRSHPDPEVMRSIELFEQFVLREFFDGETCTVYDTIGKDPKYKRLYNAPNLVQFWRELYGLKGDARYLDYIEKSLLDYYRLGGDRFYPNGCDFSSELALLERAGRKVPELREAVGRHVANIVANGIRYPEHEVRFEQTIATPAVSILAQYCRFVEKTPSVLGALEANFDVLSRFQGNQPDHKLHETAIRHWDGFWFGKRHLYGDTLHQHSTITARAFLQYAAATGDARPVGRAERCLRNCLFMFRPDGTATCAHMLPLTVTMLNGDGSVFRAARRGEFADPFVNDMDVVLYLGMRSGLFGKYGAAEDALDTNLSILVCLGKVESALFCGDEDALRERNAILRVIGELERCCLDYEKGCLFGAPDWARRGLLNDDDSLRSVNLAYARLLKLAGLLYGFGDYAARGRSLEESMLADPGEPPPFRDEATLPEAVRAYYRLMEDCRREMREEIRPGGVGGSPFWNARARLFAYPPSFPFRDIPGAASYRYEVLDDAHRLRTFDAATPTASLAPVWPAIPAGFTDVRCRALDATGGDLGPAGERRFWRSAPFDPAEYPASVGGYMEARRKVLRHLLSWPQLATLETNGIPDIAVGDNFASYPSKMQSAVIMAMLAVAKELSEESDRAMRIAYASAAYLLSTAEASGTPLAGFTATYTGTGQLSGTYSGQHMLVYPAMAGEAFLAFYRATGERQWLEAANSIGRTYLRLQGDDGTWPLKMNAADGTSVGRNRLAPTTVVPFLDELAAVTGDSAFRAVADRALASIERGPMSDWDWEGQFEDIRPAESRYQNLTKDMPCETAQALLRRYPGDPGRIAQAREMLRFAEDQFVVWRAPCRQDGTGAWNPAYPFFAWRTPAVLEQYECYSPIDASSAKLIHTYLALYKAEGRALDLAKARALGDSMVRNQDASGRIRTYWIPEPGDGSDLAGAIRLPLGGDWFNCMFADAEVLGELAKATE